MVRWLKSLFKKQPTVSKTNPYKGLFTDWHCDRYTAWSPDGMFRLWIANDFYGFQDDTINRGKRSFLVGLPRAQRSQIWEALIYDLHQRSVGHIRVKQRERNQ